MNRARRMLLAVTGVALAARLAHFGFIHGHPFHDFAETWVLSDMHQFLAWARHLASGDWLDANTFRPWFDWQEAIAPPDVWQRWYGPHVYYQPPLYPYLLAFGLALTGSADPFRVAQLALGAVNCGLLACLAARIAGPRAGWVTGIAAAVYAPFILYDGELLRGTVVIATQTAMLLALTGWLARRTPGRAAAAGALFGLAWLADPAVLLFAPAAAIWIALVPADWGPARAGRPLLRTPAALRAPAFFCAGALAALVPLVARNVWVGAPPLSSTTRAPLAFVMGNAPDARPAGAHVPPSAGPILRASEYRMLATMGETMRQYHGHYAPLVGKQAQKLVSLWGAYEVPDNPSFYYGARISPVVRFGLRFLPVAALGLVGLALALRRSWKGDAAAALLACFVAAAHAVFLLAHVNSRYRQPLAMALLVLAGCAVAWVWDRRPVAWGAAAAALLLLLLLPRTPPEGYGYDRPAEFVMAARLFQQRGEPDRAEAELRAAVSAARAEAPYRPMLPTLLFELGTVQSSAGRTVQARESFEAVLSEDPGYTEAREALEQLRLAPPPVPRR